MYILLSVRIQGLFRSDFSFRCFCCILKVQGQINLIIYITFSSWESQQFSRRLKSKTKWRTPEPEGAVLEVLSIAWLWHYLLQGCWWFCRDGWAWERSHECLSSLPCPTRMTQWDNGMNFHWFRECFCVWISEYHKYWSGYPWCLQTIGIVPLFQILQVSSYRICLFPKCGAFVFLFRISTRKTLVCVHYVIHVP